jgi:hypothetical protein
MLVATIGCANRNETAPRDDHEGAQPPGAIAAQSVNLSSIVRSNKFVGSTLAVTGECVGYAKQVAVGGQPRTRSDWQLQDSTAAIWVVGKFPPGCLAVGSNGARVSVMARVAEDTIIMLDRTSSKEPRRYLLLVPD